MPTLVEKLAAIAKTVPNLLKEGDNGEYKFIRAVDAFDAVRVKLFEAGILILPIAQRSERSQPYLDVHGDPIDEFRVQVVYRITDGMSEIECTSHGVGQDREGKALYMASTGAKKDLIKTLFLIAGWEDDSENVQDTARMGADLAEKIDEMRKKLGTNSDEWPISQRDVRAFESLKRSQGISEKAKKAFLKSRGVEKTSDLKRKDADLAMQWLLGKTEVSLESSSSSDEESSD